MKSSKILMEVNKKPSFFDTLIYGSILMLSTFVVIVSHPDYIQAHNSQSGCQNGDCIFSTNILHRATKLEINNQGKNKVHITRQEMLDDALYEAGIDLASGIVSHPHRLSNLDGGEVKVSIVESNIPVKIIDQNRTYTVTTSYSTVKNILYACDIKLNSKDKVYPDLESHVGAGGNIVIDRALPVEIAYGHETYLLETQAENIAEVMAEAKEELGLPEDLTNHNPDKEVYSGEKISLVRVDESEIVEYETIKAPNQYQDDWDMMLGEEKIIQNGKNGEKAKKYLLTLENGVEVNRQLISEEITKEAQPTIIAVGKKQPEYSAPASNYTPSGSSQVGTASWYYYGSSPSAAHRDYPKGTQLLVTNNSTGASVVVTVNDYGPAAWTGRVIDLNSVAFSAIAPLGQGLCEVTVVPI